MCDPGSCFSLAQSGSLGLAAGGSSAADGLHVSGSTRSSSRLRSMQLSDAEHVEVVRGGKESIAVWRSENFPMTIDLSNADFSGANLVGVNLNGANLSGVNFAGADLREADLSNSKISRANLAGANLQHAALFRTTATDSDFRNADFRGANLYRTNFRRSQIDGANFTGAVKLKTVWPQVATSPSPSMKDPQ